METNSIQKREGIMENNIQDAIKWFDDLSSHLQTDGRIHWQTIKTVLLSHKKEKTQEQVCPNCNSIDAMVLGFPWSRCENCGYVYDGRTKHE